MQNNKKNENMNTMRKLTNNYCLINTAYEADKEISEVEEYLKKLKKSAYKKLLLRLLLKSCLVIFSLLMFIAGLIIIYVANVKAQNYISVEESPYNALNDLGMGFTISGGIITFFYFLYFICMKGIQASKI